MKRIPVVEIDLNDYSHVRVHFFLKPEFQDHSFYRTAMSYAAFFTSLKRRNFSKTRLYHSKEDEVDEEVDYGWAVLNEYDASLPQVEHESIWAFYLAIGYDYKTKRYI